MPATSLRGRKPLSASRLGSISHALRRSGTNRPQSGRNCRSTSTSVFGEKIYPSQAAIFFSAIFPEKTFGKRKIPAKPVAVLKSSCELTGSCSLLTARSYPVPRAGSAQNDPMTLLRNCLDTGMLDSSSSVDLLFTKWDVVEANADKIAIAAFADHVEADFRSQFGARVRELKAARIAAHPSEADLPLGYGLDDLFPTWVDAVPSGKAVRRPPFVDSHNQSEYDRYLRRRFPAIVQKSEQP